MRLRAPPALPLIAAAGMLTCGAVAQKTVALVEDMNFEAEEATENKPLRVATSGGHQQPCCDA